MICKFETLLAVAVLKTFCGLKVCAVSFYSLYYSTLVASYSYAYCSIYSILRWYKRYALLPSGLSLRLEPSIEKLNNLCVEPQSTFVYNTLFGVSYSLDRVSRRRC